MVSFIISYPLFLWMLSAMLIPVLFHLFFKVRKKHYIFSSFLFFLRINPRLSSRRKIQEWLILLLRILVLLLLVLALSGIILTGIGYGGASSIVIIIDNSGSMSSLGLPSKSKLDLAKEAARGLLLLSGKEDRVCILLMVEDISVPLSLEFSSDKKKTSDLLDKIRETQATGLAAKALEKALLLLENAKDTPSQEIHIFSDFQETEWGKKPLQDLRFSSKMKIFAHAIASQPIQENIQISKISMTKRKMIAKKSFVIEAYLENTSQKRTNVHLHSMDDTGRKYSFSLDFSEKQAKQQDFSFVFDTPGLHWILFWIEGDSFSCDNMLATAFFCDEKKYVLFAGEKKDFLLPSLAIAPFPEGYGTGLEVEFVPAADLVQASQKRMPALTVARWDVWNRVLQEESAFWKKILQEGSNILALPSWDLMPEESLSFWFGCSPEQEEQSSQGESVVVLDKYNPLWEEIKDAKGEILLKNIKAFRYFPLNLLDAQGVLGLEDSKSVLSQKSFGKGKVFVSGLELDSKFCNLPLKASFVPMIQNMANMEEDKEEVLFLYAGEALPKNFTQSDSLHLRSLAGSPLDWQGHESLLSGIPRSGIYTLSNNSKTKYIAVSSSPHEAKEIFFTKSEIPAFQGTSFAFSSYENIDSFLLQNQRKRKGTSLYLPLLLLAILAYSIEGWILNPGNFPFRLYHKYKGT
ncbi:MAG: BatA domain-containing protein [Candidatus Brocadiae bacterium]|nr:BatA domain-containing protein [Candidatus Brocadiia bacterium]